MVRLRDTIVSELNKYVNGLFFMQLWNIVCLSIKKNIRNIVFNSLTSKLSWLLSRVVMYLYVRTHFSLSRVCVCVFFSQKKKKKSS